jgi:hypothetical protein
MRDPAGQGHCSKRLDAAPEFFVGGLRDIKHMPALLFFGAFNAQMLSLTRKWLTLDQF